MKKKVLGLGRTEKKENAREKQQNNGR